ncbi:MAG: alkaline phosphatase D family protein [Bacteroidota bacterium]
MNFRLLLFVSIVVLLTACPSASEPKEAQIRIMLGSCADQDKPQPMLEIAAEMNPDYFIFLGDNIYGDSRVMDTLRAKYSRFARKPGFKALKEGSQLRAIWDDHDYGENDAGRHYPFKEASKEIFMDFWEVPMDSDRRSHPGIYGSEMVAVGDYQLQLIFLDTRTFRDHLIHREKSDTLHKNDYAINQDPDSTFLGEAQWAWLETELATPADLRIIASSNQFSHAYNGWESWTNVPHEQKKMLDLIKKTKANGVIFLSGDVHWGELSMMEVDSLYPIYDLTSSGITQTWDVIEPNANRVGDVIPQNNVGLLDITFSEGGSFIDFGLVDSSREKVVSHRVSLNEISFWGE